VYHAISAMGELVAKGHWMVSSYNIVLWVFGPINPLVNWGLSFLKISI
jgi:hypothetical protein